MFRRSSLVDFSRSFLHTKTRFQSSRPPARSQPFRQPPGYRSLNTGSSVPPQESSSQARLLKFVSRTPKFLQPWIAPIVNAPVSHVTAFLILHELTAIIPLVGLASIFHTTGWLPSWLAEGKWVVDGTEKFGRYARRKGWVTEVQEKDAEAMVATGHAEDMEGRQGSRLKAMWRRWQGAREASPERKPFKARLGTMLGTTENGVRLLIEVSTAYAVVKLLLPARIIASAWATPWFARWSVVPATNWLRKSLVGRWYKKTKA